MEGLLQKKNKMIGWSSRYFVISNSTHSLVLYKDATKTELNADVAFSSSTTIEAIGATQIALSHVHENKKGGSKDSYLLDASTAAARDAWMLAFKALHQLACNAQTSTPPPSPGHGVSSSPRVAELKAKFEASSAPAPASERAPSGTSAARAVFEQPAVATSAHQTKSLAKVSSSGNVVDEAKVEEQQAAACPAQISEDAILAFCNSVTLPAINDSNLPPGITESHAVLVRNYSECISTIQASMRSMSKMWNEAQKLARQFPLAQPFSPLNSVPEPSHSTKAPSGSAVPVQSSGALARYHASSHKLSDAAILSLKRKDKHYMREVFNRHSQFVGLSATALVSALHAINPSAFPADVSVTDAAKKLKEVDAGNKGHAIYKEFCQAAKGSDASLAKDKFLRFADVRGLSAQTLMDALREVDAPVLSSSEGCSPEQIFRRADANTSGQVDFDEFMRAAELPGDLEMVLDDQGLSIFAPALRAHFAVGDDQMKQFSGLVAENLFAAVDATVESIKQQLVNVHSLVKKATNAKIELNRTNHKFSTFKAAGGTIDDFFKGLEDRIGAPNLDFKKSMCAEHTTRRGSEHTFTTGNYNITTQPCKEWSYVVADEKGHRVECPDKSHGREIKPIDELMKKPLALQAKLTEEEVIAVVLYTGPMFVIYNAVLRRYPPDIYAVYDAAGNKFSTTIFVLVSAIQKLSRCMSIPAGTLLYRGLGGLMELPDSFFVPSVKCITPNALGYCEFAFMSTTQDRNVAVQYSGVNENKPKASIMEIRPNSVDRGADISEFSQYTAEKEFVIVPYSFVQGDASQRTEVTDGGGILTVIPVRVNINLKTETVEELRGKKKKMHVVAFDALIHETTPHLERILDKVILSAPYLGLDSVTLDETDCSPQDARYAFEMCHWNELEADLKEKKLRLEIEKQNQAKIWIQALCISLVESLRKIMFEHDKVPDIDYADDLKYSAMVTSMLNVQAWAKHKLWYFIENNDFWKASLIALRRSFDGMTLEDAHRKWLAHLKHHKLATAARGSDERRRTAIQILQCKGLLSVDNVHAILDVEPLLYTAVVDDWSSEDVQLIIDAGLVESADGSLKFPDTNALNKALIITVANRDAIISQMLVDAGADQYGSVFETAIKSRRTLFEVAFRDRNLATMVALLKAGDSVDLSNSIGGEIPILTDLTADSSIFELFVKNASNRLVRGRGGYSTLHKAAKHGWVSWIEFFVANGANINGFTMPPEKTPLHYACEYGSHESVAALLKLSADVSIRDAEFKLPIHLAKTKDCIALLVMSRPELTYADGRQSLLVNARCGETFPHGGRGKTPLHYACERNSLECVEALLRFKADVNVVVDSYGDDQHKAPIHCTSDVDILQVLIANGANPLTPDENGRTPLHNCCHHASLECVKVLLNLKADVNQSDRKGITPLDLARTEAMIELLVASDEYPSVVELHRAAGTVAINRHRGFGKLSADYLMRFQAFNTFVADIMLCGGSFYFELQVVVVGKFPQFGFCTQGFEQCRNPHGKGVGDDQYSWAVDGARSLKWHKDSTRYGSKWAVGDVIGFTIDMRKQSSAVMSVSVNGNFTTPNGIAFDSIEAPYLTPAFSGDGQYRVNFGDRPFAHAPIDEHYMSVHAFLKQKQQK